ncbi:MAG: hypothetical protein ABJB33_00965, partial [Gemmatimonadota bacterium]
MRLIALLLVACPSVAVAQGWNEPAAIALVSRAVVRRTVAQGDSGLRSWHVRAHGMVLFLAQLSEGGTGTPRLMKADELDVEVYWSAPGRSKQVIRGWRDRRYLPTDIRYHRDHLGIVTDGFGPRIRIGGGDEVKDVVHPLSEEGLTHYDFAIRDSARITAGGQTTILDVIDVRPRDPAAAAVIGTVYIDRATAELVRARLSFTPVSYIDKTVEDLTILLDYAHVDGRAWLPWRQTIEIRRNAGWVDLPYIGIIRGTWEFGDYDLDLSIPVTTFRGLAIGGLGQPGDSARPWPAPFDSVLAAAGPGVSESEVAQARRDIARAIEGRVAAGITPTRVAAHNVSDIMHFDRVQGVALGAGMIVKGGGSRVSLRPDLGIGLADGRLTGGVILMFSTLHPSPSTIEIFAERRIRDLSDQLVMSRVLNSLTAQESGDDHGDYLLLERAGIQVTKQFAPDSRLSASLGWEDPGPLGISATPARGTFRPQVDLGGPGYWAGSIGLADGAEGENGWRVAIEGGVGRAKWGRATLALQEGARIGGTELQFRGYGGAASREVPAWRTFVLGGRGTLLGEGFRAWGGRQMAWGALEWRVPIPFPAIPLGDFASTGHEAVLAPFVSGGWADGPRMWSCSTGWP